MKFGRPQTRQSTTQIERKRQSDLNRYYATDPFLGWAKTALMNARRRAKERGLPCSIELEDVLHAASGVTHCPITGAQLYFGRGGGKWRSDSASIDRMDNSTGYASGTICVISTRANLLKSACTLDEMLNIGRYAMFAMRGQES